MDCRNLKAAVVAAALILTSCSKPSQPAAESTSAQNAARAGGPVSGKTALWEMYKTAHTWARDQEPLALESKSVAGVQNEGGKAGMWTATFGSPSKHEARVFSYSVVSGPPDIRQGVTVGGPKMWSGPTREAMPFQASDSELAVDSDAAFKTAATDAAHWLKQHSDKEPTIALGNAARFPGPVWYVHWGDKKNGYAVYVDAKTGAVVK